MTAAADEPIQFNRDIRPILSNACFQCHGPDDKKRSGGLRLDERLSAVAMLKSGDVAIVPGHPELSTILKRIDSHDPDEAMPPPDAKRPALTSAQKQTLRDWITQGAPYEGHWSFQPLSEETPPPAEPAGWCRTPVDQFILSKLNDAGLPPSAEADRSTLLRRLALDLTGLLPSPAETDAFKSDLLPGWYERAVDRLLASPHYGERWGRHWLDQARYADSDGYARDDARNMWPYRDWVIAALNADMPFDQFTIEQIAGDLLPGGSNPQIAASAFHRNTLINTEGGTDNEQFRVEAVMDRVSTTAAVWLGLTLGCAQCHSHKFDPVSQTDYYRIYAFFNQGTDVNNDGATLEIRRGELFGRKPAGKPVRLMVMKDLPSEDRRGTFLFQRGDFLRPDKAAGEVAPGVPGAVNAAFRAPPSAFHNRLDLARWLVSPENPLTPRVTVNRIWMRFFGRGLVETEEDFGTQGSPPTHPQLLDWLAGEFIRGGWSQKALHRLIVTSAVYRQSSVARTDSTAADPRNLLLSRQERLRVEAEIVRDAALCAGGLLHPEIGGPGFRPEQPDGVFAFTQTKKDYTPSAAPDRYRRSLYAVFFRTAPHPLFATFDVPNMQTTCTRRLRSNTPLQSLLLANDPIFLDLARGIAGRLWQEEISPEARLRRGFLLTLCRPPTDAELMPLAAFVSREVERYRSDPAAARAFIGRELETQAGAAAAEMAALTSAARVLLNTDAFITRE